MREVGGKERKAEMGIGGSWLLIGIVTLSQAYWVDICWLRERGFCLYFEPIGFGGVNGYTGFCRFLILGSVSGAVRLVGVRKIPDSTVTSLKTRK